MGARFIVKRITGTPFFGVIDVDLGLYLPKGHWKCVGCWLRLEDAQVLATSLNYTHENL